MTKIKGNLIRLDTTRMTYNQWQAMRRSYIGGSDVGTVLGLNPYQSKLELFHQKVGVVSSIMPESEATYSGKKLEKIVKDDYWQYYDDDDPTPAGLIANADKNTRKRFYMNIKSIIYDPKIGDHFRANVDGMIVPKKNSRSPNGVLEAKSGLNWVWEQYKSGIPEFYVLQVQTYMLITGLSYAEIAVLLDGRYFRCYPFEANKELQDEIISQVNEFWELVLEGRIIWESELPEHERLQRLANIEPEVDGSEAVDRYLKDRFKQSYKAGQMQITPEIIEYAKEYLDKGQAVKDAETPKKAVGQLLRKFFIDNQVDEMIHEGKVIMSYRKISENKTPVLYVNKGRLLEL